MIKDIKIMNIMGAMFGDNTYWLEYKVNEKLGYEILENITEDGEELINKMVENGKISREKLIGKKCISECSKYLEEIIEECRQSDNEMLFVEFDELKEELSACDDEIEGFIGKLEEEVIRLGLENYITFYEDGTAITVYGGVITKFLF